MGIFKDPPKRLEDLPEEKRNAAGLEAVSSRLTGLNENSSPEELAAAVQRMKDSYDGKS